MTEKHIDVFEKFLENIPPQNPDVAWKRVEMLQGRILQCEKIISDYQEQSKKYLKDENSNIASQYIALKEENIRLKSEKLDLEYKLDESAVKLTLLNTEWQNRLESEKKTITDEFNSEHKKLIREVTDTKNIYEAKLREVYNELQFNQATSALQLDEVESNLKQQLIQTADKLRDSNSSCLILRTELQNLKMEYNYFKANSNQKIADLKCKLTEAVVERPSYNSLHPEDRLRDNSSDLVKMKKALPSRNDRERFGKFSESLKPVAKVLVQMDEPSSTTPMDYPKVTDPPKQPVASPKRSGRKRKLCNLEETDAFLEDKEQK